MKFLFGKSHFFIALYALSSFVIITCYPVNNLFFFIEFLIATERAFCGSEAARILQVVNIVFIQEANFTVA